MDKDLKDDEVDLLDDCWKGGTIDPPTEEQFSHCPTWLKWKFVFMLLPYAVEAWLLTFGLKLGGIKNV